MGGIEDAARDALRKSKFPVGWHIQMSVTSDGTHAENNLRDYTQAMSGYYKFAGVGTIPCNEGDLGKTHRLRQSLDCESDSFVRFTDTTLQAEAYESAVQHKAEESPCEE